jgi:antitoxin VapB
MRKEIVMAGMRVAKLFMNGGSQAVRLPAEFRFEGDEVYARRDERTGDVVLSSQPRARTWEELFERIGYLEEDEEDFMRERPMNTDVLEERDLFMEDSQE